jgi:predicted site-specific integrase-resolvase
MKLSTWAKNNGITYKTAWIWFKDGKLPVESFQTTTGTILIKDDNKSSIPERNVIYCRVSNHSRKEEMKFQVERCENFCSASGIIVHNIYSEIASGLNDERRAFWKAIDSKPSKIIVEHKDRLTRFGFNFLDRLLKERGCEIIVIHRDKEDDKDLMKDLVSIIYSFCARLYNLRRAYNKTKKCEQIIKDNST